MTIQPRCYISAPDGSNAASFALPLTGWVNAGAAPAGTAPAPGDLVVAFSDNLNSTGAVTDSSGQWTFQDSGTGNTGTPLFESMAAWRIFDGTETSPTFTWTTAKRFCFIAVAFAPDAGSTIAIDAWSAMFMDTTSATTHVPDPATAAGAGETSFLMAAVAVTATGTTPESYTAPAGWADLVTGNSAGTSTQRVLSASVAWAAGQGPGPVAPGAWTLGLAGTGNFYHVLLAETGGGGGSAPSDAEACAGAEADPAVHLGDVRSWL